MTSPQQLDGDVRSRPSIDPVVAGSTDHTIITEAANERVIPSTARQIVAAGHALHNVVAGTTGKRVRRRFADQDVGAASPSVGPLQNLGEIPRGSACEGDAVDDQCAVVVVRCQRIALCTAPGQRFAGALYV